MSVATPRGSRKSNSFWKFGTEKKKRKFFFACDGGDADTVERMLRRKKVHVNDQDDMGLSGLHLAAFSGHSKVIKQILSFPKADINIRTKEQQTPIILAGISNKLEAVETLCELKADVNAADKDGVTLMHAAAASGNEAMVKELLTNFKVHPHHKDVKGRTPVFYAAFAGYFEIIQILVQQHPSVLRARDYSMDTVLHVLIRSNALTTTDLQFLLENGSFVSVSNTKGETPLDIASDQVDNGNSEVQDLVNIMRRAALEEHLPNNNSDEPRKGPYTGEGLVEAAARGDLSQVLLYPEHGVALDTKDMNGHCALHATVASGYVDAIPFMVQLGAPVNQFDETNNTPLAVAILEGDIDCVKVLLEQGADPKAFQGEINDTAVFLALQLPEDVVALDVIKIIHEYEPSALATEDGHGASIMCRAADTGNARLLDWLIETIPDLLDHGDEVANTPLHYAAQKASNPFHARCCRALLAAGAKVWCSNDNGDTPLQVAQSNGCPEELLRHMVVRQNIEKKEIEKAAAVEDRRKALLAKVASDPQEDGIENDEAQAISDSQKKQIVESEQVNRARGHLPSLIVKQQSTGSAASASSTKMSSSPASAHRPSRYASYKRPASAATEAASQSSTPTNGQLRPSTVHSNSGAKTLKSRPSYSAKYSRTARQSPSAGPGSAQQLQVPSAQPQSQITRPTSNGTAAGRPSSLLQSAASAKVSAARLPQAASTLPSQGSTSINSQQKAASSISGGSPAVASQRSTLSKYASLRRVQMQQQQN